MFFSGKRYFHTSKIVKEPEPEPVIEEKEDKKKNTDELEDLLGKDFDMKKLKKLFGKDFILILLKLLLGLKDKDKGRKGKGRKMRKAPSSSFAPAGQVRKERADRLKTAEKAKISLSVTKILGEKQRDGESDGDYRSRRLGELIKLVASAGDNFDSNLAVLSAAALETKSDGSLPADTPGNVKNLLGNLAVFTDILETGKYKGRDITPEERVAIEKASLNSSVTYLGGGIRKEYVSKKKGGIKLGVEEGEKYLESLFGKELTADIISRLSGDTKPTKIPGDPKAKFKPGTGRSPTPPSTKPDDDDKPPDEPKGGSKRKKKSKKPDKTITEFLGLSVPSDQEDVVEKVLQEIRDDAERGGEEPGKSLVNEVADGVDDSLAETGTWLPTDTTTKKSQEDSDSNYAEYVSSDGVEEEIDYAKSQTKTFKVTDTGSGKPSVKVIKEGRPPEPEGEPPQETLDEAERFKQKQEEEEEEEEITEEQQELKERDPTTLGLESLAGVRRGSFQEGPSGTSFKREYTTGKKQTTIDDIFIPVTEDLEYTTEEQQQIEQLLDNYASGGDKGKLLLKLKTMVKRKKETGSILSKERTKSAKTRIDSKSEIQYTFPEGTEEGKRDDRVIGVYTNKDGSEIYDMFDDIPQAKNLKALIDDEKNKKKREALEKRLIAMESDYLNMLQRDKKGQDEEARQGFDDLYTDETLDELGDIDDRRKIFLKHKVILGDALFDDEHPEALGEDEEIVGIGEKGTLISGGEVFRYIPHKVVVGRAKEALDEEHSLLVKAEEQKKLDTSVETTPAPAPEPSIAEKIQQRKIAEAEKFAAEEAERILRLEQEAAQKLELEEETLKKSQQSEQATLLADALQTQPETTGLGGSKIGGKPSVTDTFGETDSQVKGVDDELARLEEELKGGSKKIDLTIKELSEEEEEEEEEEEVEEEEEEEVDTSLETKPAPKPKPLDESVEVDLDIDVKPLGNPETIEQIKERRKKLEKGKKLNKSKIGLIEEIISGASVKSTYDAADDDGKDKLLGGLIDNVFKRKKLTPTIRQKIDDDFSSSNLFFAERKKQQEYIKSVREERLQKAKEKEEKKPALTESDETSTQFTAGGTAKTKTRKVKKKTRLEREDDLINKPEKTLAEQTKVDEILSNRQQKAVKATQERIAQAEKTAEELEAEVLEAGLESKQKRVERYVTESKKQLQSQKKPRDERSDSESGETISSAEAERRQQDLFFDVLDFQREPKQVKREKGESKTDYKQRIGQELKQRREAEPPKSKLVLAKEKAERVKTGLEASQAAYFKGLYNKLLVEAKKEQGEDFDQNDFDEQFLQSIDEERRLEKETQPELVDTTPGLTKETGAEQIEKEPDVDLEPLTTEQKFFITGNPTYKSVGVSKGQTERIAKIYIDGPITKATKEGAISVVSTREDFFKKIEKIKSKITAKSTQLEIQQSQTAVEQLIREQELLQDDYKEALKQKLLEEEIKLRGGGSYETEAGVTTEVPFSFPQTGEIGIQRALRPRDELGTPALEGDEIYKRALRIGKSEEEASKLRTDYVELQDARFGFRKTQAELQAELKGLDFNESGRYVAKIPLPGESDVSDIKRMSLLQEAREYERLRAEKGKKNPYKKKKKVFIAAEGGFVEEEVDLLATAEAQKPFPDYGEYLSTKKEKYSRKKPGIDLVEERRALREKLFGLPRDDPKRTRETEKQDERERKLFNDYEQEKVAYEEAQKRTLDRVATISSKRVTKVDTPPKSLQDQVKDEISALQPGYKLREEKLKRELGAKPAKAQLKQEGGYYQKLGSKPEQIEKEETQLYEEALGEAILKGRTKLKEGGIDDKLLLGITGETPKERKERLAVEVLEAKQLKETQKEAEKVRKAEERSKKEAAKKAQPKKSKEQLQKEYEQLTGNFTETLEYDYSATGGETTEQLAELERLQKEQTKQQTELEQLLEKVRPEKTPAGSVVSAATSSDEVASEGSSIGGGNLYGDLTLPEKLELFQASQEGAGLGDSDVSSTDLQQFGLSRQDWKPQVTQEDDSFSAPSSSSSSKTEVDVDD